MSKLNTKVKRDTKTTAHGEVAYQHLTPVQTLRRLVLSSLLWEKQFYCEGKEIADAIKSTCESVSPTDIAALAVEARWTHNLRHVPLLLLAALCNRGTGMSVGDTIEKVIKRADELTEFVAVYAQYNGVTPDKVKKKLSAQAKKGLAKAFGKFDEYQLQKYNRDGAVKLRDVLFLCHAKPKDEVRTDLYKRLVAGELKTPDTWEVALSAGANKKETFERLLNEGSLGYFALLRNLRNMAQANCDMSLVKAAIIKGGHGKDKILPFRFVAAARACPQLEPALDTALLENIAALPKLKGTTIVLVDISPSMDDKLSAKSDLTRMDAAAALASIINADTLRVFPFADTIIEVPPRLGMSGIDAITKAPIYRNGTLLGKAIAHVNAIPHDRLIVITDEQSQDAIVDPVAKRAYMINVASNEHGVGYGKFTHIDGFSENVIKYISEIENTKEN